MSDESITDFDESIGYFCFSGTFGAYRLGMELFDHARRFELLKKGEEHEVVAVGYASDQLPPDFPPAAVAAIQQFEQRIADTERRTKPLPCKMQNSGHIRADV